MSKDDNNQHVEEGTSPAGSSTIPVSGAIPFDHFVPGAHSLITAIPDDTLLWVGKIVASWGAFEVRMKIITEEFYRLTHSNVPDNWNSMGFERRRKAFKESGQKYTQQMFPSETVNIRQIATKAKLLSVKRNVLAHGYYETVAEPVHNQENKFQPKFLATGWTKGRKVQINLVKDELRPIWSDVVHLGGDLMILIARMGGKMDKIEVVLRDDDFVGAEEGKTNNFGLLDVSHWKASTS